MSGYLWEDCLVPGNDQLLDASVKDQIDEVRLECNRFV